MNNIIKKFFSDTMAIHVFSWCGIWIFYSILVNGIEVTNIDIGVTFTLLFYSLGYLIIKTKQII